MASIKLYSIMGDCTLQERAFTTFTLLEYKYTRQEISFYYCKHTLIPPFCCVVGKWHSKCIWDYNIPITDTPCNVLTLHTTSLPSTYILLKLSQIPYFDNAIISTRNYQWKWPNRSVCFIKIRNKIVLHLFQEITLISAWWAWVVNMHALDGFARTSQILIVLSTEQLAKTYNNKQQFKHAHTPN